MKSTLLWLCLLLGACSAAHESAPPAAAVSPVAEAAVTPTPPSPLAAAGGDVDYSCREAADCAIKDVGNCCGYYPACVNQDSPTFPEKVKADCKQGGLSGVCGFKSIARCECVQQRCTGVADGASDARLSTE